MWQESVSLVKMSNDLDGGKVCACVCALEEPDFCRKRLLYCATWLLLAEMKRAGIQESHVAMETTAERERETQR